MMMRGGTRMNKDNDIKYVELSKARVQDKRNLVVSSTSKGGYTIAQQLMVEEGGRKTQVFLKGAIIISGMEGLLNLRDALNVAIQHEELTAKEELKREKPDEDDWDE